MKNITGQWNLLTGVAVALCAAIGGFLSLPPLRANNDAHWAHFGIFAVTLLVGLCFVPMHLYGSRKALRGWVPTAIVCTVLSVAGFLAYMNKIQAWTFMTDQHERWIQGPVSELTQEARLARTELAKEHGGREDDVPIKDIFFYDGSDPATTWSKTGWDIQAMRTDVLLRMYLTELLLLAAAVLTVVQAVYCARRRPE